MQLKASRNFLRGAAINAAIYKLRAMRVWISVICAVITCMPSREMLVGGKAGSLLKQHIKVCAV